MSDLIQLPTWPAVHAGWAMVLVMLMLCAGTWLQRARERAKPDADHQELRLRIRSWWWMIGVLFAALLLGPLPGVLFFVLVSVLALREFLAIIPTRHADRRVVPWLYGCILVQYLFVAQAEYTLFLIFIPVYAFLFMPMRLVLVGDTDGFIRSVGVLHWGVMLTVFSISHVAYLLVLPVKNELAGAVGPVLFVLFITQFNDVCQYLWGKRFGKHRIIPKVSPNKTWEGFLGGLLTVTLCAGIAGPLLTPLSFVQSLGVGVLLAAAGFIGDVVLSSVKRDLGIKDSGSLLPGHGGILDRIDSLTFTAPLFFHYLRYLVY